MAIDFIGKLHFFKRYTELKQLTLHIKNIGITPYHPQRNDMVEYMKS